MKARRGQIFLWALNPSLSLPQVPPHSSAWNHYLQHRPFLPELVPTSSMIDNHTP
jgi:hypothetical protein